MSVYYMGAEQTLRWLIKRGMNKFYTEIEPKPGWAMKGHIRIDFYDTEGKKICGLDTGDVNDMCSELAQGKHPEIQAAHPEFIEIFSLAQEIAEAQQIQYTPAGRDVWKEGIVNKERVSIEKAEEKNYWFNEKNQQEARLMRRYKEQIKHWNPNVDLKL